MAQVGRKSAIQDPNLRKLCTLVLREYRRTGSARTNENLKHVRRMVDEVRGRAIELKKVGCDAEALEVSILVSDLGKEPHLLEKYAPEYGGSLFAVFLDHSRVSMREVNLIRKRIGVDSRSWRKVLGGIIGHDGPSIPGSWWKQNYEREIHHAYARIHTVEALIHCYLDRIDQGGIFRTRNGQLNGGLRKISYDLYTKEGPFKGNLSATIEEVFGKTRTGTYHQLSHLDHVLSPLFLGPKRIPSLVDEVKSKFDDAESYFQHVLIDSKKPNVVGVRLGDGKIIQTRSLDEFWQILARVTPRTK